MGEHKRLEKRGLTLVPAGLQQQQGPDGNIYAIPVFQVRDADGNIQALNTEQGMIPITIMGTPINISRAPGLTLPPSAGTILTGKV